MREFGGYREKVSVGTNLFWERRCPASELYHFEPRHAGETPALPGFIVGGSGGKIPGAGATNPTAGIYGRLAVLLPDALFQRLDWWPAGNPPVS